MYIHMYVCMYIYICIYYIYVYIYIYVCVFDLLLTTYVYVYINAWSLFGPLKNGVIPQHNGVMNPFSKGHGDSRWSKSRLSPHTRGAFVASFKGKPPQTRGAVVASFKGKRANLDTLLKGRRVRVSVLRVPSAIWSHTQLRDLKNRKPNPFRGWPFLVGTR